MNNTVKNNEIGLFAWLRGRFFAGVVIAAPIAITFAIVRWIINVIDDFVKPLLPPQIIPESYLPYAIPGFGLIVAVITLTILGGVASNLIGRSLVASADRLLSGIPVVSNVYTAVRQLFDVVGKGATASYKEVVLIEYPKRGTWAVGFVSGTPKGEIAHHLSTDMLAVFIPTTPNPTSGFLVFVPNDEVKRLTMTVEDGAKFILSAGLVTPEFDANAPLAAVPSVPHDNTLDGGSIDTADTVISPDGLPKD